MNNEIFFDRIIGQVEFGLWFLEDYLNRHQNTDIAGLRCIHILLSFHFELLLKSLYLKTKSFNNEVDIEEKLRKLGHNIEKIGKKLGKDVLLKIDIKNIFRNNSGYIIETQNREIKINDFTDIRYDFIMGRIRNITQKEHQIIKEDIENIRTIVEKIKKII